MSDSDLSIKLPAELIERAARDKINASIASALGNPDELISKLVGSVLSASVDSNGKPSNRGWDEERSYLDYMAADLIKSATKEAMEEYFKENHTLIKDAVKKEISRSSSKLAKVFTDGLVKSLSSSYSTKIDVRFDNRDER